jgi:hypothetical protein
MRSMVEGSAPALSSLRLACPETGPAVHLRLFGRKERRWMPDQVRHDEFRKETRPPLGHPGLDPGSTFLLTSGSKP